MSKSTVPMSRVLDVMDALRWAKDRLHDEEMAVAMQSACVERLGRELREERAKVEELTRERDKYFALAASLESMGNAYREQSEAHCSRAERAEARLARVVQWLTVVLDETDYTAKACSPTEMVGAVLPREVIESARAALAAALEQPTQACSCHSGSVCGTACAVGKHHDGCAHQPTQEKP